MIDHDTYYKTYKCSLRMNYISTSAILNISFIILWSENMLLPTNGEVGKFLSIQFESFFDDNYVCNVVLIRGRNGVLCRVLK